jgi:trimeric autotransporter adhesin
MWMVFNAGFKYTIHNAEPITSISMLNGELRVGEAGSGSGNLSEISFLADKSGMHVASTIYYYIRSALSQRNTSVAIDGAITAGLVNREVNDVAMTVLPNAPIDPATGLPVPTIAVATDGGVSVITDSGAVYDSSYTAAHSSVNIYEDRLSFGYTSFDNVRFVNINEITADGWTGTDYSDISTPAVFGSNSKVTAGNAIANAAGLNFLAEDPTTPANGMVAYATSTYNTGWMNGDIKGAFLSDTTAETLVGTELVTNGDFASDIASWTDVSTGTGSIAWNASEHMDLIAAGLSNRAKVYQGFSTVIGKTYTIEYTLGSTANHDVLLGSSAQGNDIVGDAGGTDGAHSYTFVAISTTTYVTFSEAGTTTATVDNITCRLADPDRSVNNNGLAVYGSVTKAAVATGAELMGYNEFSATDYLEQPYNSDLDFGTGDFHVMGWVKQTASGSERILDREGGTNNNYIIIYTTSGAISVSLKDGSSVSVVAPTSPFGVWQLFNAVRTGGVLYLYVDGVSVGTPVASTHNVTNTAAPLFLGVRTNLTSPFTQGSLALLRISATAPTAEQIAKIYNDEKFLFQDNAKATLYDSSDAVTALAHDPVTDLLHVGTSEGRSVFSGLRRVDNTTTAVGTAISASNGLVVEE